MARATRATWAKRVREWKRSGLTAATYAERKALKPATLLWWSSQLNVAGRRAPPVVEVVASTVAVEPSSRDFELVLADETHVLVPTSFDDSALRRLLAVLREG